MNEGKSEADSPSNLQPLRDAAKWLTTAAGAVGAVLVGSLRLSDIRRLEDSTAEFLVMLTLLSATLTAIGGALWSGAKVFRNRYTSLAALNKDEEEQAQPGRTPRWLTHLLYDLALAARELPGGRGEVPLNTIRADLAEAAKAVSGPNATDGQVSHWQRLQATTDRLIAVANYTTAARYLRHLAAWLGTSVVLGAGTIVVFAMSSR